VIDEDTIAAIATPLSPSGVGVIRISGAKAPHILFALFKRSHDTHNWQSHRLYFGSVIEPVSGALLDKALAVWMRAPHSYTQEQVVEFHCHGGPVVLAQVLQACLNRGARLAKPGEFTLRAFLNGALSLDEAEAVADLISAKTSTAAQLALNQLTGTLSNRLKPLEKELLALLAQIAVGVDFPEDADAPTAQYLLSRLQALRQTINEVLAGAMEGRLYREGLAVVLSGAGNVGKSSLFNCLLNSHRAIVDGEAGTTRDIIEETINVGGLPLILSDTAGFREQSGLSQVESQGIERSRAALAKAGLVLIVTDGILGLDNTAKALLQEISPKKRLLVLNKIDILNETELQKRLAEYAKCCPPQDVLAVSAKNGAGVSQLLAKIGEKALSGVNKTAGSPWLTNIRHQEALQKADSALAEAEAALTSGFTPDVAAIDLENAYIAIGEISGHTVGEEVLNNIFANFCLGK